LGAVWVYVVLAATVIVQEEAAPLAGGLAAHHGHAHLPLIIGACAVGSWLGDLTLFGLGRRGGRLVQRFPVTRRLGVLQRHPRLAPFAIRFAYGLRWSLPIAAGVAGIPWRSYAPWAALSAVVWSTVYASIGWGAGALATRVFGDLEHYELPLIGAIGFVWLVIVAWRLGGHGRPGRSARASA
jgi:membrane protein DedA with SNARE-associated domain